MKIKLIKPALRRIPGTIVNVAPKAAAYLIEHGIAVSDDARPEPIKKPARKRAVSKRARHRQKAVMED